MEVASTRIHVIIAIEIIDQFSLIFWINITVYIECVKLKLVSAQAMSTKQIS